MIERIIRNTGILWTAAWALLLASWAFGILVHGDTPGTDPRAVVAALCMASACVGLSWAVGMGALALLRVVVR